MKNLILLAYEFPPLNVGGSHRPLRFVKYLRKFAINPIVVSVHPSEYSSGNIDKYLEEEIPPDVAVFRTALTSTSVFCKILHEKYYFNIIDKTGERWKSALEKLLPELIKTYSPIGVLATLPPFSLGPLAVRLSKKYELPLYLDLRDAWSQWNIAPYASYLHYNLTLKLERHCLYSAKKIIVTSEQTGLDLQKNHPGINPEKIKVITNAYDKLKSLSKKTVCSESSKLVIGYVGSFYYNPYSDSLINKSWWKKKPHQLLQFTPKKEHWLYRSPYFFFKTLRELFKSKPALRNRIRVRFAGSNPSWLKDMVNEFELSSVFEHTGFLNREEALRFQDDCDILLITSSKVEGGNDYSIAGKTFEYISNLKPILGFVCNGAQKNILTKTGLAVICDPDDINKSSRKMDDLFSKPIKVQPNMNFIKTLSADYTIEKLAKYILN